MSVTQFIARIFTKLSQMLDVGISNPTDGQVLTYSGTDAKWENKAPAGGSTPTLAQVTAAGATTSTAVTLTGNANLQGNTYFGGPSGNSYMDASGNLHVPAGETFNFTTAGAFNIMRPNGSTIFAANGNNDPAFYSNVYFEGNIDVQGSTFFNGSISTIGGITNAYNNPLYLYNINGRGVVIGANSTSQTSNVIDIALPTYCRGLLSALNGDFYVANVGGTNTVNLNLSSNNESCFNFNQNDGSAGFAFGYDGNGDNFYISDNVAVQFMAINRDSGMASFGGGLATPYNSLDDGSGDVFFQGNMTAVAGMNLSGQLILNYGTGWNGGAATLSVQTISGIAADFAGEVDIAAGYDGFTDPSPGYAYDLKCGGTAGGITSIGSINSNGGFLFNNNTVIDGNGFYIPSSSSPRATEGAMYVNSSHQLKVYLNGAWKTITVS